MRILARLAIRFVASFIFFGVFLSLLSLASSLPFSAQAPTLALIDATASAGFVGCLAIIDHMLVDPQPDPEDDLC